METIKIEAAWKACGLPERPLESFKAAVTDRSTAEEIKGAWYACNLVPSYLNVFLEEFLYECVQKEETRQANEREEDKIFKESLTSC